LWFSFNFESSIICFIISASFGCPAAGAAAAGGLVAVADVWACANEGIVINAAKRIVKNREVFMAPIFPNKVEIGKKNQAVGGASWAVELAMGGSELWAMRIK
jgi:hypothetical protein